MKPERTNIVNTLSYLINIRNFRNKSILSNSIWIIGGTVISRAILVSISIVLSKYWGETVLGQYSAVRSSINMYTIFATAGVGLASTKYIAENLRTNKNELLISIKVLHYLSVIFIVIVASIYLVSSGVMSSVFLGSAELKTSLIAGGLLLIFGSINSIQLGSLYGFKDFKSAAINQISSAFIEFPLVLLGLYFYGLVGAFLGSGTSAAINVFLNKMTLNNVYLKYGIHKKSIVFKKNFYKILQFTIPAAFSSFLVVPIFWYLRSTILRNAGFKELALFEIADQWRMLILFVPLNLSRVLLPYLSSLEGEKNLTKSRQVFKYMVVINAVTSFFIALIVFVFANKILNLYGPNYNDIRPIIILAVSTIFSSAADVIGQRIVSKSQTWTGMIFNCLWAVNVLLLNKVLIDHFSAPISVSCAILASYFLHAILQIIYTLKFQKN